MSPPAGRVRIAPLTVSMVTFSGRAGWPFQAGFVNGMIVVARLVMANGGLSV
jgi:hypothetical protein